MTKRKTDFWLQKMVIENDYQKQDRYKKIRKMTRMSLHNTHLDHQDLNDYSSTPQSLFPSIQDTHTFESVTPKPKYRPNLTIEIPQTTENS